MHFDHSRSFKVVDFCTNRKPIYDILLVISCDLSSMLHRFRGTAPWRKIKSSHPCLSPESRATLRISPSYLSSWNLRQITTFTWKPRDPSFNRFVTIHSRHRQTTDRQHIMTIAELYNYITKLANNERWFWGWSLRLVSWYTRLVKCLSRKNALNKLVMQTLSPEVLASGYYAQLLYMYAITVWQVQYAICF